jgi:hypothetical protein
VPSRSFGHYELIDEHGAVLPTWRERRIGDDRTFRTGDFELVLPDGRCAGRSPQPRRVSDYYTAMLRRNCVSMHAAVLYRRAVLDEAGGFDPRLNSLEDYEMYPRVTRTHPVACHDHVIAQYPAASGGDVRRHAQYGANGAELGGDSGPGTPSLAAFRNRMGSLLTANPGSPSRPPLRVRLPVLLTDQALR